MIKKYVIIEILRVSQIISITKNRIVLFLRLMMINFQKLFMSGAVATFGRRSTFLWLNKSGSNLPSQYMRTKLTFKFEKSSCTFPGLCSRKYRRTFLIDVWLIVGLAGIKIPQSGNVIIKWIISRSLSLYLKVSWKSWCHYGFDCFINSKWTSAKFFKTNILIF